MFGIQIKINGNWCWMSRSSGVRYEFQTEADAYKMLEISYPEQVRRHRLGDEKTVRTHPYSGESQ